MLHESAEGAALCRVTWLLNKVLNRFWLHGSAEGEALCRGSGCPRKSIFPFLAAGDGEKRKNGLRDPYDYLGD